MSQLEPYIKAFIPVFFAIDVIGILPLYMNLTDNMTFDSRRRVLRMATITALGVGIVFSFLGKLTFKFLGITISDFKIAGGLLLLIFAIQDLLFSSTNRRKGAVTDPNIGVVPLGMPLIVGPGVLTTLLLSVDINGYSPTLVSFILNMVIVYIVFRYSSAIIKKVGAGGAIAVGKVFSLLLGAIAVMMIRTGIIEIWALVK